MLHFAGAKKDTRDIFHEMICKIDLIFETEVLILRTLRLALEKKFSADISLIAPVIAMDALY